MICEKCSHKDEGFSEGSACATCCEGTCGYFVESNFEYQCSCGSTAFWDDGECMNCGENNFIIRKNLLY